MVLIAYYFESVSRGVGAQLKGDTGSAPRQRRQGSRTENDRIEGWVVRFAAVFRHEPLSVAASVGRELPATAGVNLAVCGRGRPSVSAYRTPWRPPAAGIFDAWQGLFFSLADASASPSYLITDVGECHDQDAP